jgi:hypothetical protein
MGGRRHLVLESVVSVRWSETPKHVIVESPCAAPLHGPSAPSPFPGRLFRSNPGYKLKSVTVAFFSALCLKMSFHTRPTCSGVPAFLRKNKTAWLFHAPVGHRLRGGAIHEFFFLASILGFNFIRKVRPVRARACSLARPRQGAYAASLSVDEGACTHYSMGAFKGPEKPTVTRFLSRQLGFEEPHANGHTFIFQRPWSTGRR